MGNAFALDAGHHQIKDFKMNPRLSIIVPIYNVEKFLAICLDSIIDNSWENNAYEIIIVNDASPDGSIAVANDYALKNENIRVITQENKGLGGARNTGIENAAGDYLFFLDSDDYLIKNQIQKVIEKALENNLDIIEFGAQRVDENYNYLDHLFKKNDTSVEDGSSYIENYNFENSACNKLYRRRFLLDHKIKFFEKTYVEDAPFNAEAFAKAKRVQAVSDVPVIFYQNRNSITRQKRTGDNLRKFITDSIKVTVKIHEISNANISDKARRVLEQRVSVFTSGILLMILRSNFSLAEKQIYISALKNNHLYPINNNSGILIRNLFIFFTNNKFALYFLLRLL